MNSIQTAICIRCHYEPNGNHKSKIYNTYTKHKGKGSQAYHERMQLRYKGSEQRSIKNLKNNKMPVSTYLPIITLNVNGINSPNKRHKVVGWLKE